MLDRSIFDKLNATPEQERIIKEKINAVLSYEPRIGVFGTTGTGKSSLCNALFGQDVCRISDVEACTRNPQEVILDMGKNGIKLIDVPGIGENEERDKEYEKLYSELLPELDVVLYLFKADVRAHAPDIKIFKKIIKPHIDKGKPFFFVLNQVDKLEPFREWNVEQHEPSATQLQNIYKKIDSLGTVFDIAVSKIIPVSANEKYNLVKLVDEIVRALPREKQITFFRTITEENRSEESNEIVESSFFEVVKDAVYTVVPFLAHEGVELIKEGAKKLFKIAVKIFSPCYITTAVCNSQNKADDCYELTTFRNYRDNYLLKEADGQSLIRQYYNQAPQIVANIDTRHDRDIIYSNIWKEYLSPCLTHIEENRYVECKELYIDMVNSLGAAYENK
ncbi:MAG: 50S ribosome-binding GTPase [Defluviitaleaceae bacterium]|nr:50S ribosome-binding GTPase [Defluviitaleaceae bacterium]